MSFLSQQDYGRFKTLPVALAQTELRRQSVLQICTFQVSMGETLEMRSCNLQVLKVLTPGVSPILADSSLGLCSVGMLTSTMLSSAVGLVTLHEVGTTSWNHDQPVLITAPGIYRVVVINNALNVDLSVIVTGSIRSYP